MKAGQECALMVLGNVSGRQYRGEEWWWPPRDEEMGMGISVAPVAETREGVVARTMEAKARFGDGCI